MQPASEQSDNTVVGTCLENVHQSHDKGMVRAVKSLQAPTLQAQTTSNPIHENEKRHIVAWASRTAYLVVRSCQNREIHWDVDTIILCQENM